MTTALDRRDSAFMAVALDEARMALDEGEVPVGAVVVLGGRVLGRGHNQVEATRDPTAHAEIIALGAACRAVEVPRLTGATLYATMEPCPMCAGAIVQARVARLVYACADPRAGYCGSLGNIADDPRLNHRVAVSSGVMAEQASALLAAFFEALRARGRT